MMTDGVDTMQPQKKKDKDSSRAAQAQQDAPPKQPQDAVAFADVLSAWLFGEPMPYEHTESLYKEDEVVYGTWDILWKNPQDVAGGENDMVCQACKGKLHECADGQDLRIRVFPTCAHAYHAVRECNVLDGNTNWHGDHLCPKCYGDDAAELKTLRSSRFWEWLRSNSEQYGYMLGILLHLFLTALCIFDKLFPANAEICSENPSGERIRAREEIFPLLAIVTGCLVLSILETMYTVYTKSTGSPSYDAAVEFLLNGSILMLYCCVVVPLIAWFSGVLFHVYMCTMAVLLYIVLPLPFLLGLSHPVLDCAKFAKDAVQIVLADTRTALTVLQAHKTAAELRGKTVLIHDSRNDILRQRRRIIDELNEKTLASKYAEDRAAIEAAFHKLHAE